MVKKTEIGWRMVENSLPKRMIDDSLVHLFNEDQKSISERTQFINKELARFHYIKDYDQYVKLKTRALRKFDGFNVSDSSDDEKKIYTRRTNNVSRKKVQKNSKKKKFNKVTVISKPKTIKRRSERLTKITNKSDNVLQSNESDVDLTDVNNSVSSFSSDVEDNSSTVVNHSIKNTKNKDPSTDEHSIGNSIDEDKKIEDYSVEDSPNKDHNTLKNPSVENQNIEDHIVEDSLVDKYVGDQTTQDPLFDDQNIENYSVEDLSDEDQNSEDYSVEDATDENQNIEDNSIEDLTDESQHIGVSPKKSDNELVEDDTSAIIQNDKLVLKITSTEVVKPKYTIVTDSQSMVDVMNNSWKNQESNSEELFDDDSDKDGEDTAFREINQTKIMAGEGTINKDSISLMKQICYSSSEDEELEPSLYSISSCTSRIDNHTEASNDSMRKNRKTSNVSDEAYYDENSIEEVMEAHVIDNALTYSPPNEREALEYILQHMSRVKNPEKQHLFDMQYLNESFIHLRNEYADDLTSEDDSSSQSEILHKRPTTLDEFVRVNNLVPMENKPSTITLDDLSDNDEFFVMEIPKSVIDQQLIGRKMEIKKKSVIIGDTKYKLNKKKNKTLTCIFRENNEEMSFKAVNIEPRGSFVVRQRLSSRIMKSCSPKIINNTNTRAPFPKNLKTRNPLENDNKKLRKYKEKMIHDHENIYRKTKLKLER